jgi:hypothetical protein
MEFPGGKRFAFTVFDDTDVATRANVEPIYRLLERLGFRTTKTVWAFDWPGSGSNFADSSTLDDPDYLAFVQDLQRRGFEIASHGATMESSPRADTVRAAARFRAAFGGPSRTYANHSYNRENLYWGVDRIDNPILRALYARTNGQPAGWYQGHVPGSEYWWGDVCQAEHTYVRNLSFDEINLLKVNPSMPYRDPRRPYAPWWFSASDAEDCAAFNDLLRPENQERLEREGGVCIVATHFGKRFVENGAIDPETVRLLEMLARRPGWFPTTVELLDWLRAQRTTEQLPAGEWRRMQWRWAWDLGRRQAKRAWARRRQRAPA